MPTVLLLAAALAAAVPDTGAPALASTRGAEDGTAPPSGPGPSKEIGETLPPLHLHIAVLPLVSYGSNVGVQLGGALVFYQRPDGGGARRDWLAIGGSYATRGPRSLEVKGERFDLASSPFRAFYQARYVVDDLAPYWGEGGHLLSGTVAGAGTPPPDYRYRAVGPWLSTTLRAPLDGRSSPWGGFARLRFRVQDVDSPGAALAAARPPGFEGGTLTTVHVGVLRDTRDDELSPTRGTFVDGSLFAAPPGLSTSTLWGWNVGARAYLSLAPGVVLAGRALYELKLGDVPFFERTQLEGLNYGEGLGGPGTIRGIARARLAGEEKILANLELRAILVTLRPGGKPLELGVSAGSDVGRARQRGYTPVGAAGVFGGLRAIWDRAVVVRLEAGWANQGDVAWYLAFDESF